MSTSQPIRNRNELQELKNYYYETEQNLRNYALICLGINSALRISDLLDLRWRDVYSFERSSFLTHISIQEQKTGKKTRIALNKNATQGLGCYMDSLTEITGNNYIFPGRSSDQHLSRTQAFRIIRHASEQLHFENKLSCHSA
jgi:site-specific recombinase XerD